MRHSPNLVTNQQQSSQQILLHVNNEKISVNGNNTPKSTKIMHSSHLNSNDISKHITIDHSRIQQVNI